jgi:beta-galactosidase GanA
LVVDGKPFLMLAGELRNSNSTSSDYLKPIWPRLTAMHVNTVLSAVQWDVVEPQEGKFDFSLVDTQIRDAEIHNLRLVFLWFGSWKNGNSSYVPAWVKTNLDRFPRVQTKDGRGIEVLSTLSAANRDADAHAFAALMRHIKQVDARHRVVMMQVENEVGLGGDSRDRSEAANKAFAGPVPTELLDYIAKNKDRLYPRFRQAWEAAGSKTSGTWQEVFGEEEFTDAIFMAWNYASYIQRVAAAGKAEYPLPMFVNNACSMPGPGRPLPRGGGRPQPEVGNVWKAAAPAIDFRSPDLYTPNLPVWANWYQESFVPENPLFIPETDGNTGTYHVFYVVGQHDGMGFSPFAIDEYSLARPGAKIVPPAELPLARSYNTLAQLAPVILDNQGKGKMAGAVVGAGETPQKIPLGNYILEVSYPGRGRPAPGAASAPAAPPPAFAMVSLDSTDLPERSGALFISTGPDEYLVAGSGPMTVRFSPNTPGDQTVGMLSIEEGTYANGHWVPGRRLNGDEYPGGGSLRLGGDSSRNGLIQRIKLYRYR